MIGRDSAIGPHKSARLNSAGGNSAYERLVYVECLENLNHFDMIQLDAHHILYVCRGNSVYQNALCVRTHLKAVCTHSICIIRDGRTCYVPYIISEGDVTRIKINDST